MAAIQIRNLSDEAYKRLQEKAEEDRRSIQQEAAWLLERTLLFPETLHQPDWSKLDQVRERLGKAYGTLPDSTPIIREMREQE